MITTINEFKIYLENNISPLRFKESDISDILDFVDELLYSTKNIDITEKIAGQHLTVNIKNGFVTVNNKDSLLNNTGDKNARHTKYGSELTRTLMKYMQTNKLPDQTWAFEIVNPQFNHDYINYKNTDIIFIEYTGNLTDQIANDLRKYLTIRLLTKNDIKINIDKNQYFDAFKKEWEGGLKTKYETLNPRNKSKYYFKMINDLKYKIGELLEHILVSVVDKVSPVEGIVISTKNPIKLQTNTFLQVQRIQMPLFSIFKVSKNEIDYILNNPLMSFEDIKTQNNLELTSIYKGDMRKNLFDVVKTYLINNSKLANIDTNKYKRWLTPQESTDYLNKLNNQNVILIYKEIYAKVK